MMECGCIVECGMYVVLLVVGGLYVWFWCECGVVGGEVV